MNALPMDCISARTCRCLPHRQTGSYDRDCHAHNRENVPTCEVCDSRMLWTSCWSTMHFTGHRYCVERAEATR